MPGLQDKIEEKARDLLRKEGGKYGINPSSSPQESLKMIMRNPMLVPLKKELMRETDKLIEQELGRRFMERVRAYDDKVVENRGRLQDEGMNPDEMLGLLGLEFEDMDPDDITAIKELIRSQMLYRQQQEAEAAKIAEEAALAVQQAASSWERREERLLATAPTPTPNMVSHTTMNSFEYTAAISAIKKGIEEVIGDMKRNGLFPQDATVTFDENNKNLPITIRETGPAGNIIETTITHSHDSASKQAEVRLSTVEKPEPKPSPSGATIQPGQGQPAQPQPGKSTTPSALALDIFARTHGDTKAFAPLALEACGAALAGKLKGAFDAVGLGDNLELDPKDGISGPKKSSIGIDLSIPNLGMGKK